MRRIISLMLALALCLACMLPSVSAEPQKISVITTIFPIYDWAREVIGDNEHVQLSLLLDSGVDLRGAPPGDLREGPPFSAGEKALIFASDRRMPFRGELNQDGK